VRDLLFEREFLDQVCVEASRRAGIDTTAYTDQVQKRLALGATRYGDDAYLAQTRDNLREAMEEAPDLAAYALLELQKLNARPVQPEGVHHHLFEASVNAAIADWHTRQARPDGREVIHHGCGGGAQRHVSGPCPVVPSTTGGRMTAWRRATLTPTGSGHDQRMARRLRRGVGRDTPAPRVISEAA